MENEFDTPAEAGTEDVQPEQTDTAPDWDYYDPDEDTVETPEPDATEDDGQSETEDPETEAEAEEEAAEESETETFDLPDGTKVERDELVKGYLRQSDYTRKATDVAEFRKSLDLQNQRLQGIINQFQEFLSPLVDSGPDPSLAQSNPQLYVQQKAQHDAIKAEVDRLIQLGSEAKDVQSGISEAEMRKTLSEENRKLMEKMPVTANQKTRQEFFSNAYDAAREVGLTEDELNGVTDHRLFILAHWAKEGMKAAKAREKVKAKAAKAPPAAPNKPGKRGGSKNADAMRKLAQSGSIHDAVRVDFE